jgi:hypothetical protein
MDDRVHAGGLGVEGEPEALQSPWFAPRRCTAAVPSCKMLGECGQKDVPAWVTCAGRLSGQQLVAALNRFPSVFLKELGNQSPPL